MAPYVPQIDRHWLRRQQATCSLKFRQARVWANDTAACALIAKMEAPGRFGCSTQSESLPIMFTVRSSKGTVFSLHPQRENTLTYPALPHLHYCVWNHAVVLFGMSKRAQKYPFPEGASTKDGCNFVRLISLLSHFYPPPNIWNVQKSFVLNRKRKHRAKPVDVP